MTPKVAVCSPCTDMVPALFAHDFARMMGCTIRQRPEIDLMSLFMPGSLISKQRECLALEVLKTDYTHVLWLDTDMRFPPETLIRLLRHGKRLVAANYVERRPPYRPLAFPVLEEPHKRVFTEPDSTGLERIDAIGLGCVLVDVDVFCRIAEPWFATGWVEHTQEYVGEDLYFFAKCREAGEELWLDHDLSREVLHIGSHQFSMKEARQARESGLMDAMPYKNSNREPEPVLEGAAR